MAAQSHDSVDSAQNSPNFDELFEFLTEGDVSSTVNTAVQPPTPLTELPSAGEASIYHGNSREEVSERLRLLLLELLQLENGVEEPPSLDLAAERSVLWLKFKQLEHEFQQLEHEARDVETLSGILSPALEHQIAQSPEALAHTLSQIVDRMIGLQNEQNPSAMSRALAVAIPGAISKQLGDAPDEVIEAIAPAMGKAIMAQVRLDEDAMIDALYPVIGNTISKYMGEVVSQINQRLEAAFSPKRLVRYLWLRLRGISEAEMILRDAVPFQVQAAFLIHKESGLVIAEVQQAEGDTLEGDLLAGMLTAIRSFASDCATGEAHRSELTKIDYEDSQIVMEVAGSCYIAAVIQGDPPLDFFRQLRYVLSAMILNHGYGEYIESFNGDPSTVPSSIKDLLTTLVNTPGATTPQLQKPLIPPGALRAIAITLLLLGIPLLGLGYWRARQAALEREILQAIQQTEDLAVYRLGVEVRPRSIILQGRVPYPSLRRQTEDLARQIAPHYQLDNQIATPVSPPPPEAIAEQLQQTAQVIRQLIGIEVVTTYDPQQQQAVVQTPQVTAEQQQEIYGAFATIEAIQLLVVEVATNPQPWQERIYFDLEEAHIASEDIQTILIPLVEHLQANPQKRLNIVGHTDDRGEREYNEELAARRAAAVQRILIEQGIAPSRLFPQGSTDAPPQVLEDDPMSKSRCVRFEIVEIES